MPTFDVDSIAASEVSTDKGVDSLTSSMEERATLRQRKVGAPVPNAKDQQSSASKAKEPKQGTKKDAVNRADPLRYVEMAFMLSPSLAA